MAPPARSSGLDPFFLTRNHLTGITGTGIGINLVKTLVEMHGGSIKIQSKIDEGSTFTIYLPIDGPEETGQEQAEQTEEMVA